MAFAIGVPFTPEILQSQTEIERNGQTAIAQPAENAEYNAYTAALRTDNPYTVATFVTAYPQSAGVKAVLEQLIEWYVFIENKANGYSNVDEKVRELSERLRQIAPIDVRPLAVMTAIDRRRASMLMENALSEMCGESASGLMELPSWRAPEGMRRSQFNKSRTEMAYTFNAAAGQCAFQAKNLFAARRFYESALRFDSSKLDDLYQLTLTDLEMKPIDPKGFQYCEKVIAFLKGEKRLLDATQVAHYCEAKRGISRVELDGRTQPGKE